jgi:hypothetical protein
LVDLDSLFRNTTELTITWKNVHIFGQMAELLENLALKFICDGIPQKNSKFEDMFKKLLLSISK